MAELWSAVVLVGRGQLGQVDTLRRDPLHEGPDKGFPFFDMDLQRHQALDFLAPKEIQSLMTIGSVLETFSWKNTAVLLDYVNMRGGRALPKFLSHFQEVHFWSIKEFIS